jgi:hypothetical protein
VRKRFVVQMLTWLHCGLVWKESSSMFSFGGVPAVASFIPVVPDNVASQRCCGRNNWVVRATELAV